MNYVTYPNPIKSDNQYKKYKALFELPTDIYL